MARCRSSHDQGRIHVNVMACQVQGNKSLENNSPTRPGRGQEDQEACSGAPISHHVEHSTESSRLFEVSSSISIESIEETGNAVEA
jgi:hypothetical protein